MYAFVYAKSCQNGKLNECDFAIHVVMYKKNENVRLLDATVFGMLYWLMYICTWIKMFNSYYLHSKLLTVNY